jgi:predicted Zn-dependent protease
MNVLFPPLRALRAISTPLARRGASSAASAALVATLTLLAACDAPTAARPDFAYDPTQLSEGQLYRWPTGQTIRVWADVGTGVAPFDLQQAVRQAIATWNAQPRFGEFVMELAPSASQANLIVFDRSRPLPIVPGSCAFDARASFGYTYFCANAGRAERLALASGASSTVSVVIRVDRSLVADQAGLNAIVAHEFGHALGIGAHSPESTDLMFGLPRVSAPSPRDMRTLQYVLGAVPDITL